MTTNVSNIHTSMCFDVLIQPLCLPNLGLLSIIVGYVLDTLMVDIISNDKDIIQVNIIMYTNFDIVGIFMLLIS